MGFREGPAKVGNKPFRIFASTRFRLRREDFLTGNRYVRGNRGRLARAACEKVMRKETRRLNPAGFSVERSSMSLSSARNYALRAERSQDAREAADLLAKAILELAASIEATDAKVKKMNKSG
jgi:hypothetical protein